jgi:hypothetical protein
MQKDLQLETMRIYKTLTDVRGDWAGKLVLLCGPNCVLEGEPVAASIAGGTTLAIDSDAAAMKSAMRAGYLDFVVNTLDEALRTLKNEIRQKRPLSVGLIANVNAALTEMIDRGVLPDLEVAFPSHEARDLALTSAFNSFLKWRNVSRPEHPFNSGSIGSNVYRFGNVYYFAVSEASNLHVIDEALLVTLPLEDLVRRHWIERVPKYLREARSGGRWIWLSDKELASLAEAGLSPVLQP